MVRTPGLGRTPSPHDKSHPDNYGGLRRPGGAPPPDSPGIKGTKGCFGAFLLILAAPVAVLGGAAEAAHALGWL